MNFLNTVFSYFWRDESLAVLLMVLGLVGFLLHFRKDERESLLNTLGFFFVCLVGQLISGFVHALEFKHSAELVHEVFIIGSGIAVIRLWSMLIFRIVLPLVKWSPLRITEDIIIIIACIAWGMVRLRYAGLDLGSIVATSAVITAVIAFAMQDTLGNILGGLALQLDHSIQIGDWIEMDGISGKVVDIRWRSTLVETRNWETVVFPNSQLMKNKFMVLGRRTDMPVQLRRWIWFNVSMATLPSKVIRVVEEPFRQTDIAHVAKNPPPNCVLMEMNSKGYARYALRYWLTDLAVDDPTDAAMRWHVMTALQRVGIKLAIEEGDIHITREDEQYEEDAHRREIQLRIKTLRRVELFSGMTDEELLTLAERLRYAPFAKGSIITRQGTIAHWLYVIIKGEAEVYLEMPGGGKRTVRNLVKRNFFGEMGMMTGEPRAASVIATTDVECYRLDKEVFEEILRARPVIAEAISFVLATRRAELESILQSLDSENTNKEIPRQRSEILSAMKNFFGLGN